MTNNWINDGMNERINEWINESTGLVGFNYTTRNVDFRICKLINYILFTNT